MSDSPPFACRLDAFTPAERKRWNELLLDLRKAVTRFEELPNGYAVIMEASSPGAAILEEFVTLERKCCPFLTLHLPEKPAATERVLEITGAPGVKEFLASQWSSSDARTS